ncbi:MAG: TonB-dependent receptor [Candidatus Marinimicrobia bacterium]|nr:TonB-dependent receptor [Candidatus Neomarinimicrobiota bacterium]MDD5581898.1 TonB-dependent receptor [Candidatus Neomarinimicrobiota bacterium]
MVKRWLWLSMMLLIPNIIFAAMGKIMGTVTDAETGVPLPGVNIVIEGTTMGAATNEDGSYVILDVPPGIYSLQVTYIGYARITMTNVRVTADLTTQADFEMKREAIRGETVTVVAERPIIEKSATNEVRVVRSEDILNLPVRTFTGIVSTQTGVVSVGEDIHVRGGRVGEVGFYVDGVYVNNPYNLSRAGEIPATALEEISYQAGGFNAEYGSAAAGIVNTTTKSGGENWDFQAEYITDGFLNGWGDIFDQGDGVLNTYSYGYNQLNASIGGPLTNRVRLFLNAEKLDMGARRPAAGKHGVPVFDEEGNVVDIKMERGPIKDNEENSYSAVGNLLFDLKPFRIRVGGSYYNTKYRLYSHQYSLLNSSHQPTEEEETLTGYARLSGALGPNTVLNIQASYFNDKVIRYDSVLGEDYRYYGLRYMPTNGICDTLETLYVYDDEGNLINTVYHDTIIWTDTSWVHPAADIMTANGTNPPADYNLMAFYPEGSWYDAYLRTYSYYYMFTGNIMHQTGNHELKTGFEYRMNNIRRYTIIAPGRLASSLMKYDPLLGDDGYYNYSWDQLTDADYRSAYADNMGWDVSGFNDLPDDHRDGAREPVIASAYVQDKIELSDMILNAGIRYDYYYSGHKTFFDPEYIVIDETGDIAERVYASLNDEGEIVYQSFVPTEYDSVGLAQLKDPKGMNYFSPRLGFAFPVTDKTVFHAQYGKFIQPPNLQDVFISYARFASNLSQGNFTESGNPELKPIEVTSYEIGFKQIVGGNASFDITMFYKQLDKYVQERNIYAIPTGYATFVNGDYGTVKGFSLAYNLRRTQNLRMTLNYTLQWAAGTGSTSDGQYKIVWQGGNFPTYVAPLDFDQRHTASLNVDYRTGNKGFIKNFGVNALINFGSGRRYTPTVIVSEVFPPTSNTPVAAINSGTMPWTFQTDLSIDKSFFVGGKTQFTTYLSIINLFNRDNVRTVYSGTGNPDDDGYLATPAGQSLADTELKVKAYKARLSNPYNYENARQVLLGVRFNFTAGR